MGRRDPDPLEGSFLSVVLPALDEQGALAESIRSAQDPCVREIVVVDGGSRDGSLAVAQRAGARVLQSPAGRALQMNRGAAATDGQVILFLHADTLLPRGFAGQIRAALACPDVVGGRFDVRLSGSQPALRVVEFFMNLRSRWTGISTGDQAIFVRRSVFEAMSGFREMPLMEDVELTHRLGRFGRRAALRSRVKTSSRRWETNGVVRTVVLMWGLRLAFAVGVSVDRLASIYARTRPRSRQDWT